MLYQIMNSQRFWAALARDLCSKPETGNLFYPVGDYSTTELIHWALRRLRARDAWASNVNDPSQPLKFRSRVIEASFDIFGAEPLRGGRWLFAIDVKGTGPPAISWTWKGNRLNLNFYLSRTAHVSSL